MCCWCSRIASIALFRKNKFDVFCSYRVKLKQKGWCHIRKNRKWLNILRGYYTLCNKLLGNQFMKDTTKHIIGRNKNSTCTGLLIFRLVMEPLNSGESTKSPETYKNTWSTYYVASEVIVLPLLKPIIV